MSGSKSSKGARTSSSKSKAFRRLEKIESIGLAKQSDFVKHGRIDKAGQDRLRRLEKKADRIRDFLKTREYQVYVPRTKASFRDLLKLTPQTLRRLKLPFVLIQTGQRVENNQVLPNKIRRIRRGKGKVQVDTEKGFSVRLLLTPRQYVRNPAAALRRVAREAQGYHEPLVAIHTGKGVIQRKFRPGAMLEEALSNLYTAYTATDPENDPQHAFEDWFEGFTITAGAKKHDPSRTTRTKSAKVRPRGKAARRSKGGTRTGKRKR